MQLSQEFSYCNTILFNKTLTFFRENLIAILHSSFSNK